MNKKYFVASLMLVLTQLIAGNLYAQRVNDSTSTSFLDLPWKKVATGMPDDWYGTEQAKAVAENVLLAQHIIGGWSKNKPYHHPFTAAEKEVVVRERTEAGSTFDNGATINEMIFLAKMYSKIKDDRYRKAFNWAFDYVLQAQYKNGGWPQFFPLTGKVAKYASHITYNDNAMVNVLVMLRDIAESKPLYEPLLLSAEQKKKAKQAFDKGIECILRTQIIVNGQPTVWCAQHDEVTFAPAKARAYELPSFSGSESVGIVLLLMEIPDPSKEIIQAVKGAVKWFDENKITGIRLDRVPNGDSKTNLVVVEDKNAPVQWARFYDLETGKPFFSDRDGVKKNTVAELGAERRNGYSWYVTTPERLIKKYSEWKKKWNVE